MKKRNETKKTKLWIVTELFYPEETSTAYILTKIANRMNRNYNVHVICGPSDYSKERVFTNYVIDPSIKIERVSNIKLDKNILLFRLFRLVILSWKLSASLNRKIRKGDKVLVVTNPALLLLFISLFDKVKKNGFSILVHDVFPENTIPAGLFRTDKNLFFRLLKYLFDKAYGKARKLIVLGRDMKNVVLNKIGQSRCNDVVVIENWAECKMIQPQKRNDSQIILQYAGNLGRVQGLIRFLYAVKNVDNQKIVFTFWGDGAIKNEMIEVVRRYNLNNVLFKGTYKREEQNKVLNQCDVAIVTLAEGMYGLGVPSKVYNIMAAGKAILFIGDLNSETALMIREHNIGFCFDSIDYNGIVRFLSSIEHGSVFKIQEMGNKARKIADEYYSEDIILSKYEKLL